MVASHFQKRNLASTCLGFNHHAIDRGFCSFLPGSNGMMLCASSLRVKNRLSAKDGITITRFNLAYFIPLCNQIPQKYITLEKLKKFGDPVFSTVLLSCRYRC